jgi:hypothetical protein
LKERLEKSAIEQHEKNHKKYIHDHEKVNISLAEDFLSRKREYVDKKKSQDAQDMKQKVLDYEKDIKEQKRAKSELKKQYCKWQEDIQVARRVSDMNER